MHASEVSTQPVDDGPSPAGAERAGITLDIGSSRPLTADRDPRGRATHSGGTTRP